MKRKYYLGLDVAKEKVRAALCNGAGTLLWEADLPVSAAGRIHLLEQLRRRIAEPGQLLGLIEATAHGSSSWFR
jgi:predicted NBD/HSP70 family sugar kinase